MNNHLLVFKGTECPHCDAMQPLFAKLAHETGESILECDVWKDESAYRKLENYRELVLRDDPDCDGIPFFYNTKTGKYLCGEVNYKALKGWATDMSS